MTDSNAQMSPGVLEAIDKAAAAINAQLEQLPTAERLKHHRKMLRGIAFSKGVEGVSAYKVQFPEAVSIRVNVTALAYSPKPAGYDDYLVHLAERWLTNDIALRATNATDVTRLNARFGTLYNPAKHFSDPLSEGRLRKIKAAFAEHNTPLHTDQANTMSKVRAVAKAAKGRFNPDRAFGNIGAISGNTLVVNERSFVIEQNGERQCIRVTIHGKRRRLYLDELEWIADWFGREDGLSTTILSIGELAYSSELPEIREDEDREMSDLAYSKTSRLSAKLAAPNLCYKQEAATSSDDDVDPLSL